MNLPTFRKIKRDPVRTYIERGIFDFRSGEENVPIFYSKKKLQDDFSIDLD